jgi:hypothetical protein
MMQMRLQNCLWQLQKLARNLGAWGLLGLFIALLSALVGYAQLSKLALETEALQTAQLQQEQKNQIVTNQIQAEQIQAKLTQANQAQAVAEQYEDSFSHFYQQFDGAQSLTKQLGAIHRSAMQQGIQLNRGDYQVVKLKKAADSPLLQQYQVALPIKAPYLKVQGLIAAVLRANPSLALTDLQITRDSNLNPSVDARVVFTLYFKGEM